MSGRQRVSFTTKGGRKVTFLRKKRGSMNKLPLKLKKWAQATRVYHELHPGQHTVISKRGSQRHKEIKRISEDIGRRGLKSVEKSKSKKI